jgi:hypothetical protein
MVMQREIKIGLFGHDFLLVQLYTDGCKTKREARADSGCTCQADVRQVSAKSEKEDMSSFLQNDLRTWHHS